MIVVSFESFLFDLRFYWVLVVGGLGGVVIIYNKVREAARREVFREHDFSSQVCCKLLALGNGLPFSLVCQWAVECGFLCCNGKCCKELSRFFVGGCHIDPPLFDLGDVGIKKDVKKLSRHGLTPWVMVFKYITGMWGGCR